MAAKRTAQRRWTDDDLRTAVASSTTYREVLHKLGLRDGAHRYVKDRIRGLGIDTRHFDPRRKNPLAADAVLRELVATSRTRTEILEKLGVPVHSNNFFKLVRRLRSLGLDPSQLPTRDRRRTRWSDDDLRRAVQQAHGFADAIRRMGLVAAGGNYVQIQRRIRELALDTSHFRGRGWNIEGKHLKRDKRSLEELLVANRWTSTRNLKQRLLAAGIKSAACELCGWAQRAPDGRVPVELDHINGKNDDNRIENLRILCPNCHALQPTHRGLNRKRRTA